MKYFLIVVQIFLSLCSHPLPAFWSVTIQLTNSGSPLITESRVCVINDDQWNSSLSSLLSLQSLHRPELTSHFLSTCQASVEPEPNKTGGVVTLVTHSLVTIAHSRRIFIFSSSHIGLGGTLYNKGGIVDICILKY